MSRETKKQKKQPHATPVWVRVMIVFLSFILAAVLVVVVVLNVALSKINRPNLNTEYYTEDELRSLDLADAVKQQQEQETGVVYPEISPEDIIWTQPAEQIAATGTIYNFLLIGQDAREDESRARSDTMIIVSFNKDTKEITMCSILRDLYVQIPGYNPNRINASYAFGGMELLDATIQENFGIKIDANLEVRFDAFERIIDTLGGVDINLTTAEANYMNLPAGMNHMNGETALSYSRIRYLDSDFGRTERQRNVLTNIYQNFKNASLTKIIDIVNTVFPMLTTDLSNTEILAYAVDLFPILAGSTMETMHVPADNTYTFNTIDSMAVIVADMEANREILKDALE